MRNILLIIFFLATQLAAASDDLLKITVDEGIELNVKKFKSNRSLPHAFYDQAVSSIPVLYPEHVFFAKRRYGHLGNIEYSIICYKETENETKVSITGAAILDNEAWSFATYVPESSFGDKLLIVLEAIENFPSNKALQSPTAAAEFNRNQ